MRPKIIDTMSGDRTLLVWLRAFVLTVCLTILLVFVWYEASVRQDLLREAEANTRAQAISLIQHSQDTFEMTEVLLQSLADQLPDAEGTPDDVWRVSEALGNQLRLSYRIRSIAAYDENGKQLVSSHPLVPDWADITQSELFDWHRTNFGTDLRIGMPFKSPRSSDWLIPASRRLEKANGAFGGVLVGTIRGAYFDNFYSDLGGYSNESVALFSTEGVLLARYPFADALIGEIRVRPDWKTTVLDHPHGALQVVSPVDGVDRVFGFAQGARYPIVQFVGVDRSAILTGWLRRALLHSAGVLALVAVSFVVGMRLADRVRLRQFTELELLKLARTDALTGLANRRAFDEALGKAVADAPRTKHPLSLLLLDVDHFKAFNDTYGHQDGDRCLELLAAAMQSAVHRPADVVARYGGEEFAVLLPDTDVDNALLVAERIRTAVHAMALRHETSRTGSIVTVSIGCATRHAEDAGLPLEDLVRQADRALYKAKLLGRDRVESAALSLVRARA